MTEQTEPQQTTGAPKGQGSFCIPRTAIKALLDAQATAYEICAYLSLARFTDDSGCYSPASIKAVNTATGANKTKGGPVDRAIERLKTIRARRVDLVSNGRAGKTHAMVEQFTDLGPILYDREAWIAETGEVPPDGPNERSLIRFVLPDFGEPKEDRVWIGNNLVSGVKTFDMPLKALKNAGDVAARLLLALYAANDMETWGGVRPVGDGHGPWKHYKPVAEDVNIGGMARLIRAKDSGPVGKIDMFSLAWPCKADASYWTAHNEAGGPVWRALEALEAVGLVYEVVMVLNRNAVKTKFSSGGELSDIPNDAEPLYELDARSHHGFKPEGEEGIGGATAKTAGDLGQPVAVEGGRLDGTYAAIVPRGYPAMIAGIYRLRFRVANRKNAGVKGAWARIHTNNRDAFDFVQALREAYKWPPLVAPWDAAKAAKTAATAQPRPDPAPVKGMARYPWEDAV